MALALRILGLPDRFLDFVAFLCAAIDGVAVVQGVLEHVYWIDSGIIQGCALSGSLFAFSTAAFLTEL
eukprot:2142799-Pyramimonas_sp.AAC.1